VLVDELPEEMEFEYDLNVNKGKVHVIKTKWLPKIYDFDLATALYNRHIDRNAKIDMYFYCVEGGICNTRDRRYDVHGFIVGCYKRARAAQDQKVQQWIGEVVPQEVLKHSLSEEYVQNALSDAVKRAAARFKEHIPSPFQYLASMLHDVSWVQTFMGIKPVEQSEHAFVAPALEETYTSFPTVSAGIVAHTYPELVQIFKKSSSHFLQRPLKIEEAKESANDLLKEVINAFDKLVFVAGEGSTFTRLYTQWSIECKAISHEWNVAALQLYLNYVQQKRFTFHSSTATEPIQVFRSKSCMAACLLLTAPQYYGLSRNFRNNLNSVSDIPFFINDIFATFRYRLPVAVPALYKLELY
jgi:hypothetical protein